MQSKSRNDKIKIIALHKALIFTHRLKAVMYKEKKTSSLS